MPEPLEPTGTPDPDATRPASVNASDRPAPDALPEAAVGDNETSETTPDPDSPLRTPGEPELPEPVVGEGTVDRVIQGHTYDGIREYDNPMPGWWVALFWAGIVFAPIYMLGVHVFDWIDDYDDDFAEAGERLEAVRTAYAVDGSVLQDRPRRAARVRRRRRLAEAGAVHFAAICAACHGDAGQGTIGPNLTDAYWIHGADPEQLWASIAEGLPSQGDAADGRPAGRAGTRPGDGLRGLAPGHGPAGRQGPRGRPGALTDGTALPLAARAASGSRDECIAVRDSPACRAGACLPARARTAAARATETGPPSPSPFHRL